MKTIPKELTLENGYFLKPWLLPEDSEHEVLLPHDSRYIVVGKYEVNHDENCHLTVIQLVAIDDNARVLEGNVEK